MPAVRATALAALAIAVPVAGSTRPPDARAAQVAPVTAPPTDDGPGRQGLDRTFPVGERFTYDVKFSAIKVGSAWMEVLGQTDVRGTQALHVKFEVKGGTLFYRVHDVLESWIDTARFQSLRHHQDYEEGSRDRERWFEMFPERRTFQERGKEELPSSEQPLDEGSFLYFVRTLPLEVGRTYEFNRYFKPDRNPVRITVVRKETIRVPAGTFDAIVLRPVIKAKGLFSEGGKAEIWLADDSTRALLQLKTSLPIGSLNLYLREFRPRAGAAPVRGR
jgi:hypothetical protein